MFNIINNIYTMKDSKWINELDDNEIQPVILNKFLSMNNQILPYVRFLDKYTYYLTPKSWLALAWSIIPKYSTPPFCKYIKKIDDDILYDEVWKKIKYVLDLGDNDFESIKYKLVDIINKDKIYWFKVFGFNKQIWEKHNLVYDMSSEIKQGKSGLELFGI